MLTDSPVFPTLPTLEVEKAKDFYQNVLGLKLIYEKEDEVLFEAGKGSRIYLYERPKTITEHTLAAFYVDDIYKTIDELAAKGVRFEQYNRSEIKTDEKGVVTKGKIKMAWFRDPDGNILGLSQIE